MKSLFETTIHRLCVLLALAPFIGGCNDSNPVVDVPNPNRVKRKSYDSMSTQEKIDFINKTPMPQAAKDKQIAQIKADSK